MDFIKTATVSPVWFWANAYKVSLALFSLLDLGILDSLASQLQTVESLAESHNLSAQALSPMLQLLVSVGILEKDGMGYMLLPSAVAMLPLIRLEAISQQHHITPEAIANVLQDGTGMDPMTTPEAEEWWPTYLTAMAVSARTLAPYLVRFVRQRGAPTVLDLGGADGALVLALSRFLPGMRAVVVDRPRNREAFWRCVKRKGCAELFEFVEGDLKQPENLVQEIAKANLIILSNVLHLLSPAEQMSLVAHIQQYARPGAVVLIYDQFLPSQECADVTNFMVIDWMLCGYDFACTEQAFAAVMSDLGFGLVTHCRLPGLPGALIKASVLADSKERTQAIRTNIRSNASLNGSFYHVG